VAARRYLSYLPGELRLYENMTGWRLVRFLNDLRGHFDHDAVTQAAREFDIDLNLPIKNLSSGMKRKVALVQVLTAGTPLLILDEPTNTLDPTMRDALLRQLRRAREAGRTVLFSSHVLSEVEQVCDRVGILQKGKLVHLQALAELRQARRIRVHLARHLERIPDFAGLQHLSRDNDHILLSVEGPLAPVLQWLANQEVRELTVEPAGLDAIYHKYHGPEA
jgi:ABC-2 type transport system ATP-binding protein